jgi:5-methylcytosine-specific restriction endonuclease McrA
MAFPDSVKDAAFSRSAGRCECRRTSHASHGKGRCKRTITRGRHTMHFHHVVSVDAGGPDTLKNCEALCIPCHQLTKNFGR